MRTRRASLLRPFGRGAFPSQATAVAGVACALLLLTLLPQRAISAGLDSRGLVLKSNEARMRHGQSALRVDSALTLAAQQRAEELMAWSYVDHVRPDGASFASAASDVGYPFQRIGENIGIDFLNDEPLVEAWLDSPSHQRNLLGPSYLHIGVGVATGLVHGTPTMVVVQLLGELQDPAQRGWKRLPSMLPRA